MKVLQSLFVLIGLLFFTGVVALYLIISGGLHFSGLLLTVPICLFVLFICLIFDWLTTTKRKIWLAGLMGISLLIASIKPIQHYYKMSIPTVDAEIDVSVYQPFTAQNKVVKSDTKGSLQLVESLPRLDGATAMYPLYAAFVEATYPKGYYPYDNSRVMVSRTPEAYQHLISGDVDLIFVAAPSESQKRQAEMEGLTFDMTPIGREAFVFFCQS